MKAPAAADGVKYYKDGDGASVSVNDWQRRRAETLKIEVRASPGDPDADALRSELPRTICRCGAGPKLLEERNGRETEALGTCISDCSLLPISTRAEPPLPEGVF